MFFPRGDSTAQLMNGAAVFAVGFLMRPFGAWLMGLYADRRGRKAGLTLSVSLMCLGSLAIAVTPGAAQVGLAAPVVLVLARLLQGLSLGGEYGASATYLSEMADARHRGFWSSFQYVTLIGGQLIALTELLVLQRWLTPAELEAWGWRIPFLIGGALAWLVFWLRRRIDESPQFLAAQAAGAPRASLWRLFRVHPRAALQVMGLTAGGTLAFYAYTTYMQKYLSNSAGFSRETSATICTLALLVYALLQPAAGALSDRIGRKPLLVAFGVLGVLFTVPLFSAIGATRSTGVAFVLVLAALLIVTGYSAINAVVKAELFPAHIRALGVALPYSLANALFGGTAEYVALRAKQLGHEPAFFWYVTAMIAVSLAVYLGMPDSRRASLIEPSG